MPGESSVRILLIDGDIALRKQLQECSRAAGYLLAAVDEGPDAFDHISATSPDVVLVRKHMAENGFVGRIRSLDAAPRVLLITDAECQPGSSQGVPMDGCITIPFTQEQFTTTLELALHQRGHQDAGANNSSILIAEADPSVRKLLCAILEAEGYTATEAADEDEARRLVLTMRFDVVIVDVLSSSPGRPPLAAQLLSLEPALCILFLSPTASGSGPPQSALGNLAFLPKPFAVSNLLEAIAALLRQRRPV